ncbi:MAG: HEAT repeat domain-containing protein [Candidatus Latescibacteria bacterium]|nr:HEAT repeat domain-containing protein [Candidatus Latescibacterota bacterium]
MPNIFCRFHRILLNLAVYAVGVVGCGAPTGDLVELLDHPDHGVRMRASQKLVNRRGGAVDELIEATRVGGDTTRFIAAQILGRIGDPSAALPLTCLLIDAHPHVRERAAEALGVLGDTLAVAPLIHTLKDSAKNVRAAVALSLGKLWTSQGLPEPGNSPQALIPVMALADDVSPEVRANALAALYEFHTAGVDTQMVVLYLGSLSDHDSQVRFVAVQALGNLGALFEIGGAEVVRKLILRLSDTTESVQKAAFRSLIQLGEDAVIPLETLFSISEGDMQSVARRLLETITGQPYALVDEIPAE